MNKNFIYKAFGITFKSEFEIPELLETNENPEIFIELGSVPDKLQEPKKAGVKYQATRDQFLLDVDNIAKYYVTDGNKIIIDLKKNTADKEVRLFLLGSAFGALFIQRGLLPIHGSAIKFDDKAVVFSGQSGVGKSSVAANFVKKGFQFLADDISLINDELLLQPSFPNLKIWDDILKKINLENESLNKIRPEIKKFDLRSNSSFYNQTLPVKAIFILSTKNSSGFDFEEVKGIAKFNAIKNNTYRYKFIDGLEKQLEHFKILNKLLPEIKVYRVSRPQAPVMLNEFTDFILNIVHQNA